MGRLSASTFRRASAGFASVVLLAALGHLGGVAAQTAPAAPPAVAPPAVVQIPPAMQAIGPQSVADLAAGLLDSVVNISTSQTVAASRGMPNQRVPDGSPFQDFFDEFFNNRPDNDGGNGEGRPRRVQSLGSGFVVDPAGIVITNNHVIEDADEIAVNFNDGTRLIARIIGRDTKTDIAVLQVNPLKPLKALKFGDSDELRVGDWVMAIGNPFGLGGTVTVGILSARNRDINSGPYDDFLQTDAAINRGNSGGPLFNMKGEVIGINTAIISPTGGSIGIGFAVPSQMATHIIEQLREFGETRRGWLGVRIQQVTEEIADGLGMEKPHGALVSGVTEESPAAKVGLTAGDVVLTFNGRAIREMRDLPRMVADTAVDSEVELRILRKGQEQILKVKLARLNEGEVKVAAATPLDAAETKAPSLGLKLADLTAEVRRQFGIGAEVKGVAVTAVEDGSPASEKGIEPGNVIVEVAQEIVTTPADVDRKVEALKTEKRRTALLLLADKSGELRFVAVRLD